jgi:hypothetical protein
VSPTDGGEAIGVDSKLDVSEAQAATASDLSNISILKYAPQVI